MNTVTDTLLRVLAEEGATESVVAIDLSQVRSDADQFLLYTAPSHRQGNRITTSIKHALKSAGISYRIDQGQAWTIFDTGDTLIHVFTPMAGRYYRLDRLWGMCPQTLLTIPA